MAEDRNEDGPDAPDTQVKRKRRRWWLWIPAWCFGLLLIAALAGWAVVGGRSRVRWKQFEAKHAALRSKVLSVPVTRRPLEGAALAGNAWKFYEDAVAAYEALPLKDQQDIMEATYSKTTPEKDAKAFALLDAHPEIFALIRQGAQCDAYDPPYQWERGAEMELPWLAHNRLLARLLAIQARHRRGDGDLDGALDSIALGLQVGADAGRSGVLICWLVGIAVRGITLAQAGPVASDPALTAAQAGRLEKLMDRLEEELVPLHVVLDADRLAMGFTFLGSAEGNAASAVAGSAPGTSLGRLKERASYTWRHGGSWHLAFVEVDARYEELTGIVHAGEIQTWASAQIEYDRFITSIEGDPLLDSLMYAPKACENSGRSGLARIRLVHAVCHERRTGAPENPLPRDPHTLLALHRRVDPDKTVYWAEWEDGDQGGKGTFEENPSGSADIPLSWKK